jgi:hypothetical protein
MRAAATHEFRVGARGFARSATAELSRSSRQHG